MLLWKRLFWAIAVPGIVVCAISGFEKEHAHKAHWKQPEVKEYAHLYIRSKVCICSYRDFMSDLPVSCLQDFLVLLS
jgi:hypothetical protein